MKACIKTDKRGLPHNYNFFNAFQGFHEMGFETAFFCDPDERADLSPEDVVVGYVGTVRRRLAQLGIVAPEMDYPPELTRYLGRTVTTTRLSRIANDPSTWPIFIKPTEDKLFTGVVVRSPKDLIGCGTVNGDPEILCSPVVPFCAEWRCFVRYGSILDVRPYRGDWKKHYDPSVIEACVKEFVNAPHGYAIDFGLTEDGRTLLIEVNDGYALGCYGLNHIHYAKLLSARWAELTHTTDECAFDIR